MLIEKNTKKGFDLQNEWEAMGEVFWEFARSRSLEDVCTGVKQCTLKEERGEGREGARGGGYPQLQVSTVRSS